jgi:hypothetical protein
VGPAEAYLNRGARLSTLPDPHRDRGLPSTDVEPDVWRGEVNVGDQLVLVSPPIVALLGADALKDALVTLHPQSAAEALTARFRDAGGTGTDGALIVEAAEIAATRGGVVPVPVRPAEPYAGMPDRSPIPLADNVASGLAAAQSGARRRTRRGRRRAVPAARADPGRAPEPRRPEPAGSRPSARAERRSGRAAMAVLSLGGRASAPSASATRCSAG